MNLTIKSKTLATFVLTLAVTVMVECAMVAGMVMAATTIAKVRVTPQDKEQYLKIFSGEFDVVEFYDREFVLYADSTGRNLLREYGIPFTVEISDVQTFYRERFLAEQPLQGGKQLNAMGGFETYTEIVAHLDLAASSHSSIMTSKFSIGQSLQGRDLWVVKISDNPTIDEDEPEVFLASLIHAREPAGAAVTLAVMDYLTDNYGSDPFVTNLVDTREIFILPVYNPDGYVYNELTSPAGGGMWRKNRRPLGADTGVDLNRNYDGHWAYNDIGSSPVASSQTYRGAAPFSEPETQAVSAFIQSRGFAVIHNHHSYSNLELWPLGYDRFFSVDEDVFQHIGDSLTKDNGYAPFIGWNLYPTNGEADDWAYTELNIPSLTVEIGASSDGFWPSPSRIPTLVNENIMPNLFLISIADNPRRVGPPRSPLLTNLDTTGVSTDGAISLVWSDTDVYNPGVAYDVSELTGYSRLTDNAESDNGYWQTERFSLSGARVHSGSFSWKANSVNRGYHWLTSVSPVRVQPGDSLKFWSWYNIETDWDYFYVQVSNDGGFIYDNLAHPTLTTNTNPHGQNLGNGITGASGDWIEMAFDLSAYVGQQIRLRLAYYTDLGFLEEGIYLDDINLVDFYASSTPAATGVTPTNVTLSGRAAGDYYYVVQSVDAEGQIGRNSNIVKVTVDPGCCDTPGDADNNGAFNIADVTFGIARIFSSGPAPACQDEADADGNSSFNIADVTFGIARIFSSGPAPICGATGS